MALDRALEAMDREGGGTRRITNLGKLRAAVRGAEEALRRVEKERVRGVEEGVRGTEERGRGGEKRRRGMAGRAVGARVMEGRTTPTVGLRREGGEEGGTER